MSKAKENARRVVILLAVAGFIFSSVAITILALMSNDEANQTAKQQQELLEQLQEQQAAKLPLPGFSAEPFDASTITELKVETLTQGEGAAATAESTVSANYFGWTGDGKIFDSTNKAGTVAPIDFPLSGVIAGWTEGLTGVKAGSTVKLTIPADKAYGATGSPPSIGPNEPLIFIVEVKEVK